MLFRVRHVPLFVLTALMIQGALLLSEARAAENHPWYVVGFAGALTVEDTTDIFTGQLDFADTFVFGGAVGKTLGHITEDLAVGAEVIVARHTGEQRLWEFDGAIYLSWLTFPWQETLRTSFSLGVGPSYSTKVPPLERARHGADESARFTNFVFGELAIGLPSYPDTDFALRYHHRSGLFGLINGVGEGSTTFALSLKQRF